MAKFDDIPRLSRTETTILELLTGRHEMYGLEMVRASDGRIKQGTLYVTLNRMAEKGYVTSRQEEQAANAIGPPRRAYRVTGYGAKVFAACNEMAERFGSLRPSMEAV